MGNITTLLNYCGYAEVGNGRVIITITAARSSTPTTTTPITTPITTTNTNPTCTGGFYESGDTCSPCPSGTYSSSEAIRCIACPAGNFLSSATHPHTPPTYTSHTSKSYFNPNCNINVEANLEPYALIYSSDERSN
jgi:hypothetical protein